MAEPEPFDYERPIADGVARIAVDTLSGSDALHRLSGLVDQAARFSEDVRAEMLKREPPPRPIACAKGCSFCCHGQEVHVSPLETLRIAIYIAEHFPTAEIAHVLQRARAVEAMKEKHRKAGQGRASFPCPLLDGKACSVYPVRPFDCRGFNSYDPRTCELHKVHLVDEVKIEGYVHQHRIAQSALAGLQQALAQLALDSSVLDLAPALRIALTENEVGRRWLAGEPVFGEAKAHMQAAVEPPPVTRH